MHLFFDASRKTRPLKRLFRRFAGCSIARITGPPSSSSAAATAAVALRWFMGSLSHIFFNIVLDVALIDRVNVHVEVLRAGGESRTEHWRMNILQTGIFRFSQSFQTG